MELYCSIGSTNLSLFLLFFCKHEEKAIKKEIIFKIETVVLKYKSIHPSIHSSIIITWNMNSVLAVRRRFLKAKLEADYQLSQNNQSSFAFQLLDVNNDYQHMEHAGENHHMEHVGENHENDEQYMEVVEHGSTHGSIQSDNGDNYSTESSAENITLVIYKKIDDNGKILREFNILKELDLLEENMNLKLYVKDANARIHADLPITKTQFAEGFDEYCEQSKTTLKDRKLLANFLHNTVGQVLDLPILRKRKAVKLEEEEDDDDCWEDVENDTGSSTLNLLEDSTLLQKRMQN